MPPAWEDQLIGDLRHFDEEIDWRAYFPKRTYVPGGNQPSGTTYERIPRVYRSLGEKTELLIGQPSELTAVTAEMRTNDIPVWHVSLPPRGAHEWRNLEYAHQNNLTLGVLNVAGAKDMRLPRGCDILDLKDVLRDIDQLPSAEFDHSVVGAASIWDSRESIIA